MATKIKRKDSDPELFGFQDPDVDKIFTDPEHCSLIWTKIRKKNLKKSPQKVLKRKITSSTLTSTPSLSISHLPH